MRADLFPNACAEGNEVNRGDVFVLGKHRLMCGDATKKTDLFKLFAGRNPSLIISSPPYDKQRNYHEKFDCWKTLMMQSLDCAWLQDNAQLLINLGVTHKHEQFNQYWLSWLLGMQQSGWRHFGMYVWDKLSGYPGRFPGRFNPSFEFIFHLNKKRTEVNKSVPCTGGRTSRNRSFVRNKAGEPQKRKASFAQSHKTPDSVIRLGAVKYGEACGHPAQMPVLLARHLLAAFKNDGSLCYDPFGGSGTTLLACELEKVTGLAMEISPVYCAMAIKRWNKLYPEKPALRGIE